MLKMVIDGYLLVIEYVMKKEEVVLLHEWDWIQKASAVQERLEVIVLLISVSLIFKFQSIIVAFSIPKFINEIVEKLTLSKIVGISVL
jgi:hypothetical protein